METKGSGKARGGYARAAKLDPEKRREIAQMGAKERWEGANLPKILRRGVLNLSGIKIPCAVLDNGKRVLTENGITNALLGSRSGASKRIKSAQINSGAPVPLFLAPKNLQPLISQELWDGPLAPITVINRFPGEPSGDGRTALGNARLDEPVESTDESKTIKFYDAVLLPAVCDIWLKARDAGVLQEQQLNKARKAEMLTRALAHVGIVALVDEATGYQEIRPREALQAYLEIIIRKELASWAKKFPNEFYENIYKLKGWPWPGMRKNRFSIVAHYTRDLVYERLAPGLLQELENKSPRDETGNRKNKLHQWLTDDIGDPMLAQHLHSLVMFQRLALSNGYGWHRFVKMIDKVLPKKGTNLEFQFMNEPDAIES